jgi:hypothetical protein
MENLDRILLLAYGFAEIHISDHDICGEMAQELLTLIDKHYPRIKKRRETK